MNEGTFLEHVMMKMHNTYYVSANQGASRRYISTAKSNDLLMARALRLPHVARANMATTDWLLYKLKAWELCASNDARRKASFFHLLTSNIEDASTPFVFAIRINGSIDEARPVSMQTQRQT
jgi:hypothetical protein